MPAALLFWHAWRSIPLLAFREEMVQKRVPQASACFPFVGTG